MWPGEIVEWSGSGRCELHRNWQQPCTQRRRRLVVTEHRSWGRAHGTALPTAPDQIPRDLHDHRRASRRSAHPSRGSIVWARQRPDFEHPCQMSGSAWRPTSTDRCRLHAPASRRAPIRYQRQAARASLLSSLQENHQPLPRWMTPVRRCCGLFAHRRHGSPVIAAADRLRDPFGSRR